MVGNRILAISLSLVATATSATLFSSLLQDNAATASSEAQTALAQVNKALLPIENAEQKYGAEYILDHPNKSYLSDLQAAQAPAEQVAKYRAQANDYNREYLATLYTGQIILAIGSSFFGAVAGWVLIPLFAGLQSRRRG
jgi:hypothetical protein